MPDYSKIIANHLARAIKSGDVSALNNLVTSPHLDCHAVLQHNENIDRAFILHMVVMYKRTNVVKYLLEEREVNVDQRLADGKTSLHLADPNKCDILYFILLSDRETEAETKGKAEIVEYLVKEGKVNVNQVIYEGVTPLHMACRLRDLNIVKLLVDGGADCKASDNEGNSPLHYSVLLEKVDIVKYFIEKTDVDVNEHNLNGETPLHIACKSGNLDSVKLLLYIGADINSVDNLGSYCLHFAVSNNKADIVKYFVGGNMFDVNRATQKALTSLHLAASCGHLEICKLLVELGADYAIRDLDGNSALHYAALKGHVKIVEYFIDDLRQDVNKCINKYGSSPLHLACEKDNYACVISVFKNGAHYKLLDNEGNSCLDLAAKAPDLKGFRYLFKRIY